jgi:hypothetical protein
LIIFILISFHTPEEFVQPAKKYFAVITKLQLAGILMAERTPQKKPDARKNRRNALHSKNGCISEAHLLRHWVGRFSS